MTKNQEITQNIEKAKELEQTILSALFEQLQEDYKYYDDCEKEATKEDERAFCRQRVAEITKGYEKQRRKIKEQFEMYYGILCY